MTWRGRRTGVVLALIGYVWASSAAAQTGGNTVLAESLYQEGKRLVAEGKYDEACPKFAESYKLDPAGGTLLNLAACYESAGKYATAWANYNEALVAAKREGQEPRVTYASEHLAALEAKLTRLVIQVAPQANAPGLVVKLDGQLVPSAAFGIPAPIDPGMHTIDATAPGKKSFHLSLSTDAPRQSVTANIPALEDGPPPPASPPAASAAPPGGPNGAAPPPVAAEPHTHGGALRTVGYVVGAAGVVGIGVGAAFYFVARSQNDSAKSACTIDDNGCRTKSELLRHNADVAQAKNNLLSAQVAFGIGGGVLATGLLLVLVGGPTQDKNALWVAPNIGTRGADLALGGRF